jgi:hypothetical protein
MISHVKCLVLPLRCLAIGLVLAAPPASAQSSCALDPTFDAFACRIAALADATESALPSGKPEDRLLRRLARATDRLEQAAAHCAAGNRRRAEHGLRPVTRALIAFNHVAGTSDGGTDLSPLRLTADDLRADLRSFETLLRCPLDETPTTSTTSLSPPTSTTATSTTMSSTTTVSTTVTTSTSSTMTTTSTTTTSPTTTVASTTTTTQTSTTSSTTMASTTSTSSTTATTTTATSSTTSTTLELVTVAVSLTHDPSSTGDVFGVEIALDYDPTKTRIPGSGDVTISGRVQNVGPTDVIFSASDRDADTDGEDDQLFVPYGGTVVLPPGDVVAAIFDRLPGLPLDETDFTCTVPNAVDGLGTSIGGVTCGVRIVP